MMAKIVVALGGNALGKSPQEQLELVKYCEIISRINNKRT